MFDFIKNKNVEQRVGVTEPMVLIFLDGWGVAPASKGNAITLADTPNMDYYRDNFPHGTLIASGEEVGLPATEDGNSEVGHLTAGAGQVLNQSIMRINYAISDLSFYENKAFLHAVAHVKKNNSKLHIMGLVGNGEVHSSLKHLYALMDFCAKHELKNVCFHLFTDGRDSPPTSGKEVVAKLEAKIRTMGIGKVASVMGRYWAMDRDLRWERTERAYRAIVQGQGVQAVSATEAIAASYVNGKTDEFVEPAVVMNGNEPVCTVDDNDAVIFFNFRIDRPRQLAMAFTIADFESMKSFDFGTDPELHGASKNRGEIKIGNTFQRGKVLRNVYFVTMTQYQKSIPVSEIAFPPEHAPEPMGAVVSEAGLAQLRLAESEKERMVTYYFDGMRDQAYPGTDVVIIPSPKVSTYDKKPEMSAFDIVKKFKKLINIGKYKLVVMNFANPDMVAHTGNLRAAIKACEFTDRAVGEVVNETLSLNGTVAITADHGNAEELITYPSGPFYFTTEEGKPNTEHSNKPVPFLIIANKFLGKKIEMRQGALSDVAPTVLSLMGLSVPENMTGKNLLGRHNYEC